MTEFNFINNTDQFDDFIKSKIVEGKGVEYTHTDCGPPFKKYYIEDKSLEEFYEKYNKILGFRNIHLTEKPKSVSPLTVDIDFKFDSKNSNRQYKLKDVKYLINVYINPQILDFYQGGFFTDIKYF